MSDTNINYFKKRLIYKSNNRGLKETDIILGGFVNQNINQLNEEHLKMLDEILNQPDIDLYNWITQNKKTPDQYNNKIMKMIQEWLNTK
jgi:succinate dehydrogenase flavin-adding protein (antitoxin of CptAB toxin-antitoxin module)